MGHIDLFWGSRSDIGTPGEGIGARLNSRFHSVAEWFALFTHYYSSSQAVVYGRAGLVYCKDQDAIFCPSLDTYLCEVFETARWKKIN